MIPNPTSLGVLGVVLGVLGVAIIDHEIVMGLSAAALYGGLFVLQQRSQSTPVHNDDKPAPAQEASTSASHSVPPSLRPSKNNPSNEPTQTKKRRARRK